MNRSLIFTPLIAILVSLVGCRAQSERSNLQKSVTRLEQRLKNVDTYLESLKEGQKEQKTQQASAIQNKEREVQKLRLVIEQQEAAISKQRKQLDRERTQMRAEMEKSKNDMRQSQEAMRERVAGEMQVREKQLNEFSAQHNKLAAQMKEEQRRLEAAAKQMQEHIDLQDARHAKEVRNMQEVMATQQRTQADKERIQEHEMAAQREEMHGRKQAEEQAGKQDAENQHRELADRLAQFEDRLAEVMRRNADYRSRTTQVTKELEITQAKLAQAQTAAKSQPTNQGKEAQKAIALLARERKDIARLRTTIQRDLAKARQGQGKQESDATGRLKAENSVLKKKLRAMEVRFKNQQFQREGSIAEQPHAAAQTNDRINNPNIVTLHGPHTSTTVSAGTAHEHSSHDAPDKSQSGNGNHAFNGIGTLIINAHDGTVNVHVYDAAPNKKSIPAPKARSGFGKTNSPPSSTLFLPGKAGGKTLSAKARASLMMARDAFQKAKPSKTDAKQKPAKKKSQKTDSNGKKTSPKKINDLMLSV